MMERFRSKYLLGSYILLLIFLKPTLASAIDDEPHHQTAFIGTPGEVDLLLTYSYYSTNHFWNKHGTKLPTFNRFKRHSALLYAEYALNNSNSLTFNGGYCRILESLNGNSQGFEDSEIGWKHLFYEDDCAAFSVECLSIIPSGNKKSSFRYGVFGVEADLLYSRYFSLFERYGWIDMRLGYRLYQGFPGDQIRMGVAVGYFFTAKIQAIASLKLDAGLFNGEAKKNRNNVAFNANYRLLKAQLEATMRLLPWLSASGGVFWHLWGQSVGSGGGAFGAAWIDF